MSQGEKTASGVSAICPECRAHLKLQVLGSSAGYYIGTLCCCGPISRESGYYPSPEKAQQELDSGSYSM